MACACVAIVGVMSSASFQDGQVAGTTEQANDMTAKVTFACINLGAFVRLPREKLRECLLVKSRVDELKAYGRDNNLKLPQACKKQELIETILNYRDMWSIKSTGGHS